MLIVIWARKPVFGGMRTSKALTRLRGSLLESIISNLAVVEISIFYLVSLAEETDLSLVLWETPKTDRFYRDKAQS